MMNINIKTAFQSADLLLPTPDIDLTKWSVIACDQYTSNPEYWNNTKQIIQNAPSTLHLILPEAHLSKKDVDIELSTIHETMNNYLDLQIFTEYKNAMIYIERTTSSSETRAGLIGVLDLEEYDYQKGYNSQVRATEATVMDRLPPRIKIRNSASLELSHIMVLIDDKEQTVIEPLHIKSHTFQKLYDFSLINHGGNIKGYLLDEDAIKTISEKLEVLFLSSLKKNSSLLFAIGDGNHSLAAAKKIYEDLKASHPENDFLNHPARYALVELVNLHSPAIHFEAIHRIVTDTNTDMLLKEAIRELGLQKSGEGQSLSIVINGIEEHFVIKKTSSKIAVGSLQNFLDSYLNANTGKIDYIHGEETLIQLTKQPNSIGFLLSPMLKEDLFPTVNIDGALPRKTFSMGRAEDKRYYLECRKLIY